MPDKDPFDLGTGRLVCTPPGRKLGLPGPYLLVGHSLRWAYAVECSRRVPI